MFAWQQRNVGIGVSERNEINITFTVIFSVNATFGSNLAGLVLVQPFDGLYLFAIVLPTLACYALLTL